MEKRIVGIEGSNLTPPLNSNNSIMITMIFKDLDTSKGNHEISSESIFSLHVYMFLQASCVFFFTVSPFFN